MKKLQTLLGLALCGALLNFSSTASADTAKPGFATVVRVKGIANYSLDKGATWSPLVPGKFLSEGATIRTGNDGVVDVVLARLIDLPQAKWVPERISLSVDSPVRGLTSYKPTAEQNVLRLNENSTLAIDKLTDPSRYGDTVSDTELDLKQGSLYASVKRIKDPTVQYLIKTPTGVAGVRGTQLFVGLNTDGTINQFAVFGVQDPAGGVLLAPNGATPPFLVGAGQMWEAGGGGSPVPIPPALHNTLHLTFDALRTIYIQLVNYNYDLTRTLESSDFGF